jgi:thiamine-phosphate pyrophosphorylase
MEPTSIRMLDANFNRVAEGLRVVEDICRFCFDHEELQARLKSVRHRLATRSPGADCVQRRRPLEDVGFDTSGQLEGERIGTYDLLRANFLRSQQGLRCLEELFKLESTAAAREMKALRYEVYDLERIALAWLERPQLGRGLYLILSEPAGGYRAMAHMAVAAGLPVIQLRYKGEDSRRFLALATALREITAGTATRLIINDRPDVALLTDADGVHVGQGDLPVDRVRRLIGPRKLLGLSTHNLDQVRRAAQLPVDYIGFGPLYPTPSKSNPDPVTGPETYLEARRISPHPVVAIGGLTLERITRLGAKACPHFAVIGAVAEAPDPRVAMRAIQHLYLEKQEGRL